MTGKGRRQIVIFSRTPRNMTTPDAACQAPTVLDLADRQAPNAEENRCQSVASFRAVNRAAQGFSTKDYTD
jgi:hypothetical protein